MRRSSIRSGKRRTAGACLSEAQNGAFEMCGQRRSCRRESRVESRLSGQTQCAAPFVEDVEHIGLAEVDADRPPARAFAIVALKVAIDAAERDLERNALRRPSGHEIERRPHDANQMAVIFSTEVGLDLAAVLVY